ncbi:MAG: hypothetical protein AB8G23_09815 [Myxococcota bacterium]
MRIQDLLYATLNTPMRALLRSPFHGVASKHLCILRYAGRKSGRAFETPLSFVQDGGTVRLLSSHATRWWTNFLPAPEDEGAAAKGPLVDDAGYPVEVEIAREVYPGRAVTIRRDSAYFRDGVRGFLTALPRDAVVYGIGLDKERKPVEDDIEGASTHVVLVEIALS